MNTDIRRRTLLAGAGAFALGTLASLASAATKERVIKIVARKFEFVPNEIRVRKGESVLLHISAPEVPMGINFADFGARTDIVPGKAAMLHLRPDKVGSFTFVCDVFCGSGHEDMSGTLVVAE